MDAAPGGDEQDRFPGKGDQNCLRSTERHHTAMHFWAPSIDPANPMDCTQPERYALQRLDSGTFLTIGGDGQGLEEGTTAEAAYLFHTHEAAVRAASELNAEGRGPFDVVKIELNIR